MSQNKPKKPSRNLLDEISPEDLEKVKQYQAKTKGAFPVDDYWLILAEFALAYGWEAYKDAVNDKIKLEEMMTLIEAKRKLEYLGLYRQSLTTFIGTASSRTKNPSNTFNSLTRNFINKSKADD